MKLQIHELYEKEKINKYFKQLEKKNISKNEEKNVKKYLKKLEEELEENLINIKSITIMIMMIQIMKE